MVDSNKWFISGDFLRHANVEYWFIGTNIVERRVITSGMYFEEAKEYLHKWIPRQSPPSMAVFPAGRLPHPGETFIHVHASPGGRPAFQGMAGAVWLAFCSGSYLKQDGRQVPLPIGPSSDAFGYSDKTAVFSDETGLPKSVTLYATNGLLACKYEVLEATNLFGRTFPLRFRVIQLGQPANGAAGPDSKSELSGRVTAIRIGNYPELPEEVKKTLKLKQ